MISGQMLKDVRSGIVGSCLDGCFGLLDEGLVEVLQVLGSILQPDGPFVSQPAEGAVFHPLLLSAGLLAVTVDLLLPEVHYERLIMDLSQVHL